jgi:hypothetical protein
LTAYSLRCRVGLVSYRQRSWDSPFGAFPLRKVSRSFPNQMRPPAVFPVLVPAIGTCETPSSGRPHGPRLLGFDPCGSPLCSAGCLIRRTPDAPLGFALLGYARQGLDRNFAQSPLARFSAAAVCYAMWWPTSHSNSRLRPATQSIDRPSPGPTPHLPLRRRRVKRPLQGFCTSTS